MRIAILKLADSTDLDSNGRQQHGDRRVPRGLVTWDRTMNALVSGR